MSNTKDSNWKCHACQELASPEGYCRNPYCACYAEKVCTVTPPNNCGLGRRPEDCVSCGNCLG